MSRKPYPSDVTDEEWAFVAPYLILMKEDAHSVSMICEKYSMACAGLCEQALTLLFGYHATMLPFLNVKRKS
jgi:hypothetical protein